MESRGGYFYLHPLGHCPHPLVGHGQNCGIPSNIADLMISVLPLVKMQDREHCNVDSHLLDVPASVSKVACLPRLCLYVSIRVYDIKIDIAQL